VLEWLPAQWVSAGGPGRRRAFGAARHLAVVAEERAQLATLGHQSHPVGGSPARNGGFVQATSGDFSETGGPVLALQWTKDDLEALGVVRLDLSPSAPMSTLAALTVEPDAETVAAAWRLLGAGDTLGIAQVETVGSRMLLKRSYELAELQGTDGRALRSIEDLAQLLALSKPGVYNKDREQAYFDARFADRNRPTYAHPAIAAVLDATHGHVLYADQLVELVKLLGFEHGWAERFRRSIGAGRVAGRDLMERAVREAGAARGWSLEQSNALLALVLQRIGYLHQHGHALTMAAHVLQQACLKVNPATTAAFFAEVLNNGGSVRYGLGAVIEEARRFGLLIRPPCVNSSADRFTSETDPDAPYATAVRVPLTAIRGLGLEATPHILAVRAAFGEFTSLLDFCRKVDRRLVSRQDLLVLIKLGAFGFTGLGRAQLLAAEQYYTAAADILRFGDRDPAGLDTLEDDLGAGAVRFVPVAEWSPETLAGYELAHLGFYTASPLEVQRHAGRLSEEFGVTAIAELVDHPDRGPASIGGVVTNLRLRTTRKGEKMAWLTLADATGAIEAAVFPQAFARLPEPTAPAFPLREGAFLVASGRIRHEEATGTKVFVDEVHVLGGRAAQLSALIVAVTEQQPDEWTARGA
jgi:DNA polymerase-3 subunit alpha